MISIPRRVTLNEMICNHLDKIRVSESTPWFLEYWNVKDQILEIIAQYKKPHPPMSCGIGTLPRNQIQSETESPLELCSSPTSPISSSDQVGCCHDSVSEIAKRLFDSPRFSSLCLLKMSEYENQIWKKDLTHKVSLECMENAMEEREIRLRLTQLAQKKLFDL